MWEAGRGRQDAGCEMLDAFLLAGGSGSAAASHTCTQHRLCGTGLGSSRETPKAGVVPARLEQIQLKPPGNNHRIAGGLYSAFMTPARYYSILLPCIK